MRNLNQNASKIFDGYQQTYSEVHLESQKIQSNQHNIEGEQ